jgi:hypothetical protein
MTQMGVIALQHNSQGFLNPARLERAGFIDIYRSPRLVFAPHKSEERRTSAQDVPKPPE